MAKNGVNAGDTIEFADAGAVTSGQVLVIGNLITIAAASYAAAETGVYYTKGRFTVAKLTTAVIAAGEMVMWDASGTNFDDSAATPATGDVTNAAIAAEAAGNGVTSIDVFLNQRLGTVA